MSKILFEKYFVSIKFLVIRAFHLFIYLFIYLLFICLFLLNLINFILVKYNA